MARTTKPSGSPLVLVIHDEEWTARSIETVLKPKGYAVLKAYTGRSGLDLAQKVLPDVILVDLHLPDMKGQDLASRLRDLPTVHPSTPIVVLSTGPVARSERLSCLRKGVWQVIQPPFDPDELTILLDTYMAAKRDADHARDQSHQDPLTGFYNIEGLVRRITEVTADATRHHRPLACVVLGLRSPSAPHPSTEGERPEDVSEDELRSLANALISVTRISDVIARVRESEFVILAPATDSDGATRLAERVLEAIDRASADAPGLSAQVDVRAGFYAVSQPERDTVVPEELLTRATTALRRAQRKNGENGGGRIRPFIPELEE